ncbi:MAG: alpha/beta hydrolase-fold protein [Bacteroidota bacterium]
MSYISRFVGYFSSPKGYIQRTYQLRSQYLNRKVRLSIYRPAVSPNQPIKLLLCLDGQDFPRMHLSERLKSFAKSEQGLFLLVGIHAADRMREYGTADRLDYKGRGDQSRAHQDFIIEELLPWLSSRYHLEEAPASRAIIGFSLGGLHAFDLAWRCSDTFGSVGVFSGALWWRSKPFLKKKPDANRIVHDYVTSTIAIPKNLRIWLMAGTEDEEEDRNSNGIIDAIDDTIQLQALLEKRGFTAPERLTYHEEEGGRHEAETWGKVLPQFLEWWLWGKGG